MPKVECVTMSDDPNRKVGVVYLDQSLSKRPAAHILIIGVAAYQSDQYKELLRTATISAREFADWFVDRDESRFNNPGCPLGSVAILLSETRGLDSSDYAGGGIPRATFNNTQICVRSWLERINSTKDNLAIMYVASHGKSYLSRTAFLLEDFGMDPDDATAGMCEVEQFVGSLENAKPVSQLILFDCCRQEADERLQETEQFGRKLIALRKENDDHGEPRKQWAVYSTAKGQAAYGLANGPSFFSVALKDALNGVASDTTTVDWPVRPGTLVDKIARILALHRLPGENIQTPSGKISGSFEITYPGEFNVVPVYVSLKDPLDWPESTLTLTRENTADEQIKGNEGDSPFKKILMPEMIELKVQAIRDGMNIGVMSAKIRVPATFMEVERNARQFTSTIGTLAAGRGLEAESKLIIKIESILKVAKGAVAQIVSRDRLVDRIKEVVVAIGDETVIDLLPGDYTITLLMPDGSNTIREFAIARDDVLEVRFETDKSPHEWMEAAIRSGVLRNRSLTPVGLTQDSDVSVEIIGNVAGGMEIRRTLGSQMTVQKVNSDNRFTRYDVYDETPSRYILKRHKGAPGYLPDNISAWVPPVFVRISDRFGRVEIAVVPSLGSEGKHTVGEWTPALLIDRDAKGDQSLTTVIVEDKKWGSLLGFLGSGDFVTGTKLLASGLEQSATAAMEDKVSNPLAAVAGALVAVASTSPDIEQRWDKWIENIANWFPDIPDGPVILGRRLLLRSKTDCDIAKAREWLIEGFNRGVPVYSLSVDWLARGLESIPGDDEVLLERQTAARRLSNRVDPTQIFTVIRVNDGMVS